MRSYPAVARQHVHTARAHLPVDVARALSVKPSLVQKAVEAFYTRDADQLLSSPFVQNQFLSAHLQRPSAVASMPRKL